MSKVFAVTSGKGGVGKSTVSVGIATSFCRINKKVLLVDMDEGFRCLDLMLGIDDATVFDLADVLNGREIFDAVYTCKSAEGLSLIPAPAKKGLINPEDFKNFVLDAAEKFDIVIIDFPAGIDIPLYTALPNDTVFLTVAVPDPVSIRDASVISGNLAEYSLSARLIINRFIYRQSRKISFKNIDSIIDSASLRLIGIVPESEELLTLSQTHNIPKRSRAALAFNRISSRLMGENVLLPKLKKI